MVDKYAACTVSGPTLISDEVRFALTVAGSPEKIEGELRFLHRADAGKQLEVRQNAATPYVDTISFDDITEAWVMDVAETFIENILVRAG